MHIKYPALLLPSRKDLKQAICYYFPDPLPSIGSVTEMDLRTGALLARPADGKAGPYSPFSQLVSSQILKVILTITCAFLQSL